MIRDNFYSMGPISSSPSTHAQQQHDVPSSSNSNGWSRAQDKQFESALVSFPEETPNRWENIASRVPGKSVLQVEKHFQDLVDDINAIESGLVELPCYTDDYLLDNSSISFGSNKSHNKAETAERRKGTPWTEEEHKLFLIGLKKYGKGDWRSISRNAVVSRTPTQVASHAQKYFNRINSDKKEKKRSSIHDITVDEASLLQANNRNSIGPVADPSQQALDTLTSQVSFGNHASASGYQGYRFPM